jgi:uncharacterized membrane protein YkgB
MWRARFIAHPDVRWVLFILGVIAFVFGVALLIGMALAALPFVVGAFASFAVLVPIVALAVFAVPRFWARLPR